jgi:hypothetical protein
MAEQNEILWQLA